MPDRIAAVILAAGASTRMGSAKQLLPYRGRPLLLHAVDTARAALLDPIVVVTGSNAEAVEDIVPQDTRVARNDAWASGPGSSIATGIAALDDAVTAVVIVLADQVRVSAHDLLSLIATHRERNAGIVASAYEGVAGAPALFARSFFPELRSLDPAQGAKPLLTRHAADVVLVAVPGAAIDVDTPEHWAAVRDDR